MIWRHLFEQEISSPSFIKEQLKFQRRIYTKMEECEKEQVIVSHSYASCVEKWEKKIDKFGLLLQYLVRDREKMLQKEIQNCTEGDILGCVREKERKFINKYYKQDLQFLKNFRKEAVI